MAHQILIPADRLAAMYNQRTQTLTLYAQGKTKNFTYGLNFARQPWVGGLRFSLVGWWTLAAGVMPYTARKRFRIPNIGAVDPDGKVNIVTANHPRGVLVPIRFVRRAAADDADDVKGILAQHGVGADSAEEPASAAAAAADNNKTNAAAAAAADPAADAALVQQQQQQQQVHGPVIKITTHVGQLFRIRESVAGSAVSRDTHVNIVFDRRVLLLVNAGVTGGDIVWTLRAAATGTTQAIVLHRAAPGARVVRKVYRISVLLGKKDLVASSASVVALAAGAAADDDTESAIAAAADDVDDDDDIDDDDDDNEATVTFDDDEDDDDDDDDDATKAAVDDPKVGAALVASALVGGSGGTAAAAGHRLPLAYLPALRLALQIVVARLRPAGGVAQLYVCHAAQPIPLHPATDVRRLQRLEAVFGYKDARTGRAATATISGAPWGAWGPPRAVLHGYVGARAIELHIRRRVLDIVEAQRAAARAGVKGRFWTVTLAWPLVAPAAAAAAAGAAEGEKKKEGEEEKEGQQEALQVRPADEPHYTFVMEDRLRYVSVGMWTGRVRVTYGAQSVLALEGGEGEAKE
jgi:hypothetical protein